MWLAVCHMLLAPEAQPAACGDPCVTSHSSQLLEGQRAAMPLVTHVHNEQAAALEVLRALAAARVRAALHTWLLVGW